MEIKDLDNKAKQVISDCLKEGWTPKDLTILSALLLSFSTFCASTKEK